jgi:hypothetical protein
VVGGELAAKLTNARLLAVLRRAGPDLRSLIVNDAAAPFTGKALADYVKACNEERAATKEGAVAAPQPYWQLQTLAGGG